MNTDTKPIDTDEMTPVGDFDTALTNFDHSIMPGTAELLKSPGNYTHHAGENFNGVVYWDGSRFCEDVWCYHVYRETIKAETLEKLMEAVNDKYGWD